MAALAGLAAAGLLAAAPAKARTLRRARVLEEVLLRARPAEYARITGRLAANQTLVVAVDGQWCAALPPEAPEPSQAVGYVACKALELGEPVQPPAADIEWEVIRREPEGAGPARLAVELKTDNPPLGETLEEVLFEVVLSELRDAPRVVVEAYLPGMDREGPGFAQARFEAGRSTGMIIRRSVLMLHRSRQP
jgi:hypothetical protein